MLSYGRGRIGQKKPPHFARKDESGCFLVQVMLYKLHRVASRKHLHPQALQLSDSKGPSSELHRNGSQKESFLAKRGGACLKQKSETRPLGCSQTKAKTREARRLVAVGFVLRESELQKIKWWTTTGATTDELRVYSELPQSRAWFHPSWCPG